MMTKASLAVLMFISDFWEAGYTRKCSSLKSALQFYISASLINDEIVNRGEEVNFLEVVFAQNCRQMSGDFLLFY
jgi:hypothetical protein